MRVPGISFLPQAPRAAAEPNRVDIALFVGFLPLRSGAVAETARVRVAMELSDAGWEVRAARTGAALVDLPVRVRSLEEVEALFDTGGRVDRSVSVISRPLAETVEIAEDETLFVVNLDGEEQRVTLTSGSITREQVVSDLSKALTLKGVDVSEGEPVGDKAPLEFRRTAQGAGSLTVYTHATLGFPMSAFDQSRLVGAPLGVALRTFFGAGGREAVIVRMGDPPPRYCSEEDRVAALSTLVGGGYGDGAPDLAGLLSDTLPELPAEYPTRDPWHGLAHLHGLEDVAMVLMPDLPELVATVPGVSREADELPRPKEIFQVCAPAPDTVLNGQIKASKPASVDVNGLEVWSRISAWAADQVKLITPEVMVLCAVPLVDEDAGELGAIDVLEIVKTGNVGQGMAHRQLQLVTPWITSRAADDMPAGAAPADGLLAGHIAASTLAQGAWRTVAGRALLAAQTPYGALDAVTFEAAPQMSVIGYGQRGPAILSDRITDPEVYNQANLRRLTALILRAARHRGQTAVFDPNGPLFWRDVAMSLTTLLRQLHSAGALRGLREEEAFQVLCGPETMSQADIDAGRAIAEITFAPAHSIEFIEISLIAAEGSFTQRGIAR